MGDVLLIASTLDAAATAGRLTLDLLTANTGSGAILYAGTDIGMDDVTLDASTLTATASAGNIALLTVSGTPSVHPIAGDITADDRRSTTAASDDDHRRHHAGIADARDGWRHAQGGHRFRLGGDIRRERAAREQFEANATAGA